MLAQVFGGMTAISLEAAFLSRLSPRGCIASSVHSGGLSCIDEKCYVGIPSCETVKLSLSKSIEFHGRASLPVFFAVFLSYS